MSAKSVWRATAGAAPRPGLATDLQAELVVVGGGIMGVTTACLMAAEHRSVVLLKARRLGEGDTGGSAGNLYETLSGGLHPLREKWGWEAARAVVASRRDAVAFIERQATRLDGASFRRCDRWIYAGSPDADQSVIKAHDAVLAAGVHAEFAEDLPPGPPRAQGRILRTPGQAQIRPLAYMQALANEAERPRRFAGVHAQKCHGRWNALERSWDCPCHGSRFGPDGTVVGAPALRPLERVQT